MTRKIVWLVMSCLIVLALVLASCGPAAVEEEEEVVPEEEEEVAVPEEEEEEEEEVVVPAKEEPQYGGTLTILQWHCMLEPGTWDPADCSWIIEPFTSPYMEKLAQGDFETYGPRGTNEYAFTDMEYVPPRYLKGILAESWDMPDETTIIYHIRKGVYWQDKPGVMSSRELTAEDVAFCKTRLTESYRCTGYYDNIEAVTALDKYTVQVKLKQYEANWLLQLAWIWHQGIYPKEAVDAGIRDWRNAVGTGPWILKDYVSGASLTWEKNPIYWGTTTINGEEYKIPFADRLIWPIITDSSTRLAALRTGKVDTSEQVGWQSAETLMETRPELSCYRHMGTLGFAVACRQDVEPFDDIRIRKALNIALDQQAMIDSLHGGNAIMLGWPFSPAWGEELFTPIDELPEAARELFEYNPEKAKQLMIEAGYPDGFKAKIIVYGSGDAAALLADYWSEINVELELQIADYGTYLGIMYGKSYEQMYLMMKGCDNPVNVLHVIGLPGQVWNTSFFNDPYFTETMAKAEAETDVTEAKKLLKHLNAYIIEKAAYIILPQPYGYAVAHPWVHNYYGELSASYRAPGPIHARIWLDRDLRFEMTGQR